MAETVASEASEQTDDVVQDQQTGVQQSADNSNTEYLDSSDSKSELFGKNYNEITYEDLQLEKPLVGKYNTIGDLEKGYKEATAKLMEKNPGAPEEYEINFKEDLELPDEVKEEFLNQDAFKNVVEVAKENNISQDALNALVNAYVENEISNQPVFEDEKAKLGDKADEMISQVASFRDRFPEAEQQYMNKIGETAEGVKFLHKLMGMMGEKSIPGETPRTQADPNELWLKAQEFRKSHPNFLSNPQAQKQYDEMAQAAVKAELLMKSK